MATSLATHKTNRAAAGAAYVAAVTNFIVAYRDLAAYDATVENSNIGGGRLLGFGPLPDFTAFAHGEFLRNVPGVANDVAGQIKTRADTLIAS